MVRVEDLALSKKSLLEPTLKKMVMVPSLRKVVPGSTKTIASQIPMRTKPTV